MNLQQKSKFSGATETYRIMLYAEWKSEGVKRTVRIAGNGTESKNYYATLLIHVGHKS